MRVAVVHEWFSTYAGSERVVEEILRLYPKADLFALVDFLTPNQRQFLMGRPVQVSFIQKLPFARSRFRWYLPLMPLAVEQLDLSAYDVVISSSHAVAKGVLTKPDQVHISYVHTPMRYAWDMQHEYLNAIGLSSGLRSACVRLLMHYMRLWDTRTSNSVDWFVANSRFIARRIRKVYGRNAIVVYPPVDVDAFEVTEQKSDYYVSVSRLVPYKRVDVLVKAFALMPSRRLFVVGEGPELSTLRSEATPNVTFLGRQPAGAVKRYLGNAKAFVFAAEEDFGIAPVEAHACGTPVIAYGKGGVAETVKDGETGVLFMEQTPKALIEAVSHFELGGRIDPWLLRRNAERFGSDRFRKEFGRVVELAIEADAGMNRQMEIVKSDRQAHIAVQSCEDDAASSYRYTRI
jgi:glycosyltransferase involved in cell wall biosynthesis